MSSLHEQYGRNAPLVLQGIMAKQAPELNGFEVENKGNHYIIKKDNYEMNVPLFASREVFKALNLFCHN